MMHISKPFICVDRIFSPFHFDLFQVRDAGAVPDEVRLDRGGDDPDLYPHPDLKEVPGDLSRGGRHDQ